MLSTTTVRVMKAEAEAFLARAQSALNVAMEVGDAVWKIEGLEEAVKDAAEAIADLTEIQAS